MHVATVLPRRYLGLTDGDPVQMSLAHLMEDEEYAEFYRRRNGRWTYVIMDNGVVETGVPMPPDRLLDLWERLQVNEMIAPDAINDAQESIRLLDEFLSTMSNRQYSTHRFPSVMFVPHGSSYSEWMDCLFEMCRNRWKMRPYSIGISKFETHTSRHALVAAVVEKLTWIKPAIHLLGCGEEMSSWQGFPYMSEIRSIDSGLPYFYAAGGQLYRPEAKQDMVRPYLGDVDVWEDGGMEVDEVLLRVNVDNWKSHSEVR